jgi:hypothetical protein
MAHYAFLDENNIVVEVIVGRDETDLVDGVSSWEDYYSTMRGLRCLRTSYNGNIRKNYAGIGFSYDDHLDAFIPPRPFPSWSLNEGSCLWVPPTPRPTDGIYDWDEGSGEWVKI